MWFLGYILSQGRIDLDEIFSSQPGQTEEKSETPLKSSKKLIAYELYALNFRCIFTAWTHTFWVLDLFTQKKLEFKQHLTFFEKPWFFFLSFGGKMSQNVTRVQKSKKILSCES